MVLFFIKIEIGVIFFYNLFSLHNHFYGWINWNKSETKGVSSLDTYEKFNLIIACFVVFFCLFLINKVFSGSFTELDAITSPSIMIGPYTQEGTKNFQDFFDRQIFPFPKPVLLIKKLLQNEIGDKNQKSNLISQPTIRSKILNF